jgi:hypothetical protein
MREQAHTLQCSEVWGGNDEVDRGVVMPGLDAWVFSKPVGSDASGGDIHYLSSCATGRITRMLVADVSGHGAGVADLALRLRTLMRKFMHYIDQARLMEKINREFAGVASGGRFATALAATFWAPTREVEVSSAGHPLPLVYRAKERAWSRLSVSEAHRGDDLPLGVLGESSYGRCRARLEPGDVVVVYTDGIVEARDASGKDLGETGLIGVLNDLGEGDAGTLASRVFERVRDFSGGELGDDATILVLSLNEIAVPRGSIVLGLKAMARGVLDIGESLVRKGRVFAFPQMRKDNILGAFADRYNRAGR